MNSGIRPRTERKALKIKHTVSSSEGSTMGRPIGELDADISTLKTDSDGHIEIPEKTTQSYDQAILTLRNDMLAKLQEITAQLERLNSVAAKNCECSLTQTGEGACATGASGCTNDVSLTDPKRLERSNEDFQELCNDIGTLKQRIESTKHQENEACGCANRTPDAVSKNSGECGISVMDENTRRKEFWSKSLHTRTICETRPVKPRSQSACTWTGVSADERECLANALQYHIEDIIDGTVFHESELPDCLLAGECLTEDECATIRKMLDRKDQIRVLVRRIKDRDLRVLKEFLKYIGQHNPGIAEKITNKFQINKLSGMNGKLCALCKLIKQFKVKDVADSLWAIQAISDELYDKIIIHSQASVGNQTDLWKEVFYSIKSLNTPTRDEAHKKIVNALNAKNLYTHLADGVRDMLLKNHEMLMCTCEAKFHVWRYSLAETSTSGESFFPDSSSDSVSIMTSMDGTEAGDVQGRLWLDAQDSMPIITEASEDQRSSTGSAPGLDQVADDNSEMSEPVNVPDSGPSDEPLYDNLVGLLRSAKKAELSVKPIIA